MRDYTPIARGELIEEIYRKEAEIERLNGKILEQEAEITRLREELDTREDEIGDLLAEIEQLQNALAPTVEPC